MDESQWLPKGIAIITPERQAMLGIVVEYDPEGMVKYARAQKKQTIAQWLHANHILDDEEYENGRDYEMWRNMFYSFCSNQRMTANYGEMRITNQTGSGYREQAYCRVIRMMPRMSINVINSAVDHEATKKYLGAVRSHHDKYQAAFSRLTSVMNIIREELEDA
jgi:hypothetical protein